MTEYYVDSDVGGPGTGTFVDPWDDIASNVGTLGPNDRMNIRGAGTAPGRIYTESPIVCNNSGTSGNEIMIRPYPGEYVVLKTIPVAWNSTMLINGDWWILDLLNFDKDHAGGSQIEVWDCDHSIFRNCGLTQNGGDGAIFFKAGAGPPSYSGSDVLIDNCTIYDTFQTNTTDSHGILIAGTRTNITVQDCTIYDIRGDCVTPLDDCGAGILIDGCHLYTTLDECSENAGDVKGGEVIFRDCEMNGFRYCDASCGGTGGGIGGALLCHDSVISLVVEDCLIHDCVSGIEVSSNTAECTMQRNVIRDLVIDGAAWLNAGIYCHANGGNTVKVYNNTFVELPSVLWRVDASGDAEFKNNIAYETHTITDGGGALVYDYNGWFNVVDSLVGAHDVTGSDPGFKDAANDNYRLRRSSAAMNAGVDVGLNYRGSTPDLGYKEHRGFVIASSWF